ncbi:MAG: hypothetical protein Q9157_000660 [Trypethelium eluteriae]
MTTDIATPKISKPKKSTGNGITESAAKADVTSGGIDEGRADTTSQSQNTLDKSGESASINSRLREEARRMTSGITREYRAYGSADQIFKLCAQQADYSIPQALEKDGVIPKTEADEDLGVGTGWWYSVPLPELGLKPTFSTWAQITMLYMYTFLVRLRCLDAAEFGMFFQHLNNAYSTSAEERMITYHHINMGGIRQKYLKDLFNQWRGVIAAYDEGLIKGDAVLATAIWRNIFKADEGVDVEAVATVTSYLRKCLSMLDKTGDEQVKRVIVKWPGLEHEQGLVRAQSPQLKAPFVETAGP